MANKDFKVKNGLDIQTPLPVSMGGTGQTSNTNTLNSLLPSQAGNNNKVLSTDGTNPTWVAQATAYQRGGTASRPQAPTAGDLYYNTDTNIFEQYTSLGWFAIAVAPGAPTGVTATNQPTERAYNNGQMSVAFTPNTSAGAPSSFVVTPTPTTSPSTFTGTSSPITVTGLASSTQYTYVVAASSAYGTSSISSASSGVTATTVPQSPTVSAASSSETTAIITITPGSTGGSTITQYSIASSPATTTQTTSNTTYTFTGLTTGTSYTFTVTATNANGTSVSSAASNAIIPSVGGSWESIQTITSSSAFSSADFTSIPQTYKHLQLRCIMGGNTNATDTNYMFYKLNGGTSYFYDRYGVNNGSAVSSIQTGQNEIAPALASYENSGAITYFYGALIIDLYDYTNTNKLPVAMSMAGGNLNSTSGYYNAAMEGVGLLTSGGASSINRITVYHQVGDLKAHSKFALYGMKG
jgi:hypothetical protein